MFGCSTLGDTFNPNSDPEDYTNPNSPLYKGINITDIIKLSQTDPAQAQQLAQGLVNVGNMTPAQVQEVQRNVQAQEQAFLLGQQRAQGSGLFDSLAASLGLTTQQVYTILAGGGLLLVVLIVLKSKKR
jgi:hypothetical protein